MTTTKKKWSYTNVIGLLLLIPAIIIFVAQYFIDLKQEVDNTLLCSIGGVGVLVWLGLSDEAVKKFLTRK